MNLKNYFFPSGDVILVVSDMDSFGYYKAVFDGRCGLVPSAFIQEMKIDDKGAQQRLLNQVTWDQP